MTSLLGKVHTRAVSVEYLEHALHLFGALASLPIKLGLQNEFPSGTVSLMDLIGMPPEDFSLLEYSTDSGGLQGLTKGQVRMAKNIQAWAMYEFAKDPRIDFETLGMDDYDAYLMTKAVISTPVNTPLQTNISPTFSYQVPLPGTPGPNTPGFNPMSYMNPSPQLTQQSGFTHNVKCDVKQYPTFSGDHSAWPKFKRAVISLPVTHGLDDVFDKKFSVPNPNDPDYQIFQVKNKLVYSVWMSRITAGLALSIL